MLKKPTLQVIFGQASHLSTSFQTSQLCEKLADWFEITRLEVEQSRNSIPGRLWMNFVKPALHPTESDYVFYGNDGVADLAMWKGKKLLYWYDCDSDWSIRPPSLAEPVQYLRFKNVKIADHVFAVSRTQERIALQIRNARNVTYLPVGVDCELFHPAKADIPLIREKFVLPEKTIIGYLGYIGSREGRFAGQPLLESARVLLSKYDIHFFIVGFGPALKLFQQRVLELGLQQNFTFTDHVSLELLPSCIAAMDICVATLEPGFHSLARSETKLKQYMAMGKASVATALGENIQDLNQGECGILVQPDPDSLAEGIAVLCENAEKRTTLGELARKRAESHYDWRVLARRLVDSLSMQ